MSLIELEDVSLDYILKTGSESIKKTAMQACHHLLRRQAPPASTLRNSSYRALNKINLTFKKGDRVGLLGRNGAGKSTLLRVLAKIYQPSGGKIRVDGKISSLFDVHLGLNPESTGYENIINLFIMRSCSRKKAQEMVADIAEFTELGDFLMQPVRMYSTGMQMKLAFAVATSLAPEIMLIDEIIGAGDAHFMTKATQRLENRIEDSHILVLTSHSNDIIKRFCNKTVVLHRGEIQFVGDVEQGLAFYDATEIKG